MVYTTVYTKVTKTGAVETKKAITIIVTVWFSGESAGARTTQSKNRYLIAQTKSSNDVISIGSTRIKWEGAVERNERLALCKCLFCCGIGSWLAYAHNKKSNRWNLLLVKFLVNPPGLEPGTPTLKVLCSTCWATDSPIPNVFYFYFGGAKIVKKIIIPKISFKYIVWLEKKLYFCVI